MPLEFPIEGADSCAKSSKVSPVAVSNEVGEGMTSASAEAGRTKTQKACIIETAAWSDFRVGGSGSCIL